MSATLAVSSFAAAAPPVSTRKIAPLRRATEAAARPVASPAMVRREISTETPFPPTSRLATLAAGAAFAGSAVSLAFFMSRKPTGSPADPCAKFRA